MRNTLFIATLLLFIFNISTSAQGVLGKWKTIDDETGKAKSIIKVYKAKNGKVYGKVLDVLDKSNGDNPICKKCKDDRKDKPIKGMILIKSLKQNGKYWQGGKILDPEKGKEYSCKIWLDSGKLKVRGYWGMFYRTQTWHKVK